MGQGYEQRSDKDTKNKSTFQHVASRYVCGNTGYASENNRTVHADRRDFLGAVGNRRSH